MLKVYSLIIETDLAPAEYGALLGLVSPEKAKRIARFRRFADAERSLLGDILARHAICLHAGLGNCELKFALNERQKPYLLAPRQPQWRGKPGAPAPAGTDTGASAHASAPAHAATSVSVFAPAPAHFNISHSGRHVVCALCSSPVGIDVETVKPIGMNIAKRFFSADERERLFLEPEGGRGRLELFYSIWTRKESFVKMTGKGLAYPLGDFSVFGGRPDGYGAVRYFRIGVGSGAVCHACFVPGGAEHAQSGVAGIAGHSGVCYGGSECRAGSACCGDGEICCESAYHAERVGIGDLLQWAQGQQQSS
ncbi:MAG: 4'-phosphopantetheinyl transferase superfamily protein [Clostridiales bacterium]|jgi:4'-phosphopantetheinyl transferase|nr:4'-phosphopantetheinyl transferase superfamily protein [Clostridiales bacterium]